MEDLNSKYVPQIAPPLQLDFDVFKQADDNGYRISKVLNINLYSNQLKILNDVVDWNTRYLVIVAARGSGKTLSVAGGLLLLCKDNPNLSIGVFAPKFDQANRVVAEMISISKKSKIRNSINWKETIKSKLVFFNGSFVLCQSASESTEGEGWHFQCCDKNTLIRTNQGDKTIGEIVNNKLKVNVLSLNEKTGILEYKPVIGWHKNEKIDRKMLKITFNCLGKVRKLVCTEDHKIYTMDKKWVKAQDLNLSTNIVSTSGTPNPLKIEILDAHTDDYVYDITVEDNHNYFAEECLVHNCIVLDESQSLHGNTKILCGDGKLRTIKNIVNKRLPVQVQTYNLGKKCYERSDIKNYFKHPCSKDCYEIEYELNGKTKKIKCSADHLIYTKNRGYVEAQHLTQADELVLYSKKCVICGGEFAPSAKKNTKTCSVSCRNKLISKTEHNTKKQDMIVCI